MAFEGGDPAPLPSSACALERRRRAEMRMDGAGSNDRKVLRSRNGLKVTPTTPRAASRSCWRRPPASGSLTSRTAPAPPSPSRTPTQPREARSGRRERGERRAPHGAGERRPRCRPPRSPVNAGMSRFNGAVRGADGHRHHRRRRHLHARRGQHLVKAGANHHATRPAMDGARAAGGGARADGEALRRPAIPGLRRRRLHRAPHPRTSARRRRAPPAAGGRPRDFLLRWETGRLPPAWADPSWSPSRPEAPSRSSSSPRMGASTGGGEPRVPHARPARPPRRPRARRAGGLKAAALHRRRGRTRFASPTPSGAGGSRSAPPPTACSKARRWCRCSW